MGIFIKLLLVLSLVSLFSFKLYAKSKEDYIPNLSDLKGYQFDEVDDLYNSLKNILPTRMGGSEIFDKLAPSTVLIRSSFGIGSGVLINEDGFIITNYHVIENKHTSSYNTNFNVLFCPRDSTADIYKSTSYTAKAIKIDKNKDLALLKLNSLPSNSYNVPARLDFSSTSAKIGMGVHAIGHPEGGSACTYSDGVISQIRINHSWRYPGSDIKYKATVIQTNTLINPGNSGGPLINDEGIVIGINSFGYQEGQGLNYAIAANEVEDFVINAPLLIIKPDSKENNQWITKKNTSKWITKKNWITTKCSEDYITAEDLNDNSINETFGYDIDCDSILDVFKIDKDEDGIFDLIVFDENDNEIYELIISFGIHEKGKYKGKEFARYVYDINEDGKEDRICFDVNMDQEIDQCRKLS